MHVDLGGARVLVVDDQEANPQPVEHILRPLGVEVALLADPKPAAKRFMEFAPDIVSVDLHMPHPDGFQVWWQIRGRALWPGDEHATADAGRRR